MRLARPAFYHQGAPLASHTVFVRPSWREAKEAVLVRQRLFGGSEPICEKSLTHEGLLRNTSSWHLPCLITRASEG